jgi:hypothetical protein
MSASGNPLERIVERRKDLPPCLSRQRGNGVDDTRFELFVAPPLSERVCQRDEQLLDCHLGLVSPTRVGAAHSCNAQVNGVLEEQTTTILLMTTSRLVELLWVEVFPAS